MKYFFNIIIILVIIGFSTLFTFALVEEEEKYKQYLGRNFVIGKDIVKVVNYSTWNETLSFDNGLTVNIKVIDKFEEIE